MLDVLMWYQHLLTANRRDVKITCTMHMLLFGLVVVQVPSENTVRV